MCLFVVHAEGTTGGERAPDAPAHSHEDQGIPPGPGKKQHSVSADGFHWIRNIFNSQHLKIAIFFNPKG